TDGLRTRSSSCPTPYRTTSAAASGPAADSSGNRGTRCSPATGVSMRRSPRSSTAFSGASSPRAGIGSCRPSSRPRKARADAMPRPFGSTFFTFSDYARPAIRLAAIIELPVIHVYTHDSIGVGEDGPTHQPVEHLASLRAIPGLVTLRPGDANEVVEAWKVIMQLRHEPVALVLSRQAMPTLDRRRYAPASGVARGAYVLADPPRGEPEVILIATGSEVSLCVAAYEELTAEGVRARVVSMPSWELFERQPETYRESGLPPAITARVAVEQASTFGWAAYVGSLGEVIGMKTFGASAPLKALQTKFGFTPERVVAAARETLARARARR